LFTRIAIGVDAFETCVDGPGIWRLGDGGGEGLRGVWRGRRRRQRERDRRRRKGKVERLPSVF